jgi:hypothetical protein
MAMVILILLPSPVRSSMPLVAAAVGVGVLAVVLVGRAVSRGGSFQWSSTMRTAAAEVHHGLLARHLWPGVLVASVVVVVGHVATFLIAARMAGSAASPFRVVPLALLVLLAMSVPTNIAGWGPREGVAAWAFGSAGLTAAQGVTTAVVYGVMVLVANVPGAVVLLAGWVHDHVQGPRTAGVLLSRPHFAETGDHVPRG